MDATEREITFVRWSTPLIVGISNMIFASFTGLRVALDQATEMGEDGDDHWRQPLVNVAIENGHGNSEFPNEHGDFP